jgi:hypothetical protein
VLHSIGGRTPKYKRDKKIRPHAYSRIDRTVLRQFTLIKTKKLKEACENVEFKETMRRRQRTDVYREQAAGL